MLSCVVMGILLGCGTSGPPSGAVVGRAGIYDYSPSVIQTGDERKFWWCGHAKNPANPSQNTDTIQYESINTTTKVSVGPITVLAETPGTWDAAYTCNPRVVEGVFQNPLGDGQTYTYALYYVATAFTSGFDNAIGVAFSNDGIQWKKYSQPVIASTTRVGYGTGQPAVLNEDGKSHLILFYESSTDVIRHIKATSTDGVHFTSQGEMTANGLAPNGFEPNWGDMGYDPSTDSWYAVFNLGLRPPSATGNMQEDGQYGYILFRIPGASLLTGATPWVLLKEVDTNVTGYEANFLPGLLHDMYGNINIGPYPQIQIYPSISNPQPPWNATPAEAALNGYIERWDIGSFLWTPGNPMMTLTRYSNLETYEVTTGWIDPQGGFKVDTVLGHLYESPQNGAGTAFYGCKNGSTDYFVSLDPSCEGQKAQGLDGYGYALPVAGVKTVPLYRCLSQNVSHFVSHDPNCETRGPGTLLGYALP